MSTIPRSLLPSPRRFLRYSFPYPLRIERGCKVFIPFAFFIRTTPFSIPCGSSVGASFHYSPPARTHPSPFSIPCGSSVGASSGVHWQGPLTEPLSVSPADRAWVQGSRRGGRSFSSGRFQYPLRIERGCKSSSPPISCFFPAGFQYPLRIERGCKRKQPTYPFRLYLPFQYPLRIERGCKT